MASVQALSGHGSTIRTATALSLLIEGGKFFLSPYYLRTLISTWSGTYDLMPPPSIHSAAVERGCPDHNTAQAWADAGLDINPVRLATSIIDREFHRTITPNVVHTAIVGKGLPSLVPFPGEKIGPDTLNLSADGDGVVTLASAKAFKSQNTSLIEVEAEHVGLCWDLKAFAAIDSVLNAE